MEAFPKGQEAGTVTSGRKPVLVSLPSFPSCEVQVLGETEDAPRKPFSRVPQSVPPEGKVGEGQ